MKILNSKISTDKDNILLENIDDVFKNRRSSIYILPSIDRLALVTAQSIDCWIAGGAALALYTGNLNIKDWDLFFKSYNHLEQAKEVFERLGFKQISVSEWSITLRKSNVDIQLVTRFYYQTHEDIFNKFDFSVCCFAIKKNKFYYTKQAKEDVEKKQLNFIYTENIATCIKRIARYGKKGYMPSDKFIEGIYDVFHSIDKKSIKKIVKKSVSKS